MSLASLLFTALLLFFAGREVAGTTAGVVWAAAIGFASGTLQAELQFGTETTLYPAIAGAILGMARWFCRGRADRLTCAILFLSAAAGGLSKLSYLVIFLPMAAMAIRLAPGDRLKGMLAMGGGLLVISPWWLFNWRDAVHYASYASGFVRHEYPWATAAVRDLVGVPFSVGLAAALLTGVRSIRAASVTATRPARALVVTCLTALIPLLLLHVMGDNHNMRLLTPAWILAAGIVVLMLHMTGAFERRLGRAVVAVVLVAQAVVMTVTVGTRVELAARLAQPQVLHRGRAAGADPDRASRRRLGPQFSPDPFRLAAHW